MALAQTAVSISSGVLEKGHRRWTPKSQDPSYMGQAIIWGLRLIRRGLNVVPLGGNMFCNP